MKAAIVKRILFSVAGVGLLAASAALPGCIAFYHTEKIQFRVVDAETQAPIPRAKISTDYATMFVFNNPEPAESITSEDGRAVIPISTCTPYLSVEAEGYVTLKWQRLVLQNGNSVSDRFRMAVSPDVENTVSLRAEREH